MRPLCSATLAAFLAAAGFGALTEEPAKKEEQGKKEEPALFKARGRLVCLAEEMKDRHGANVAPVHDHILGFRVEGEVSRGAPVYHVLLRTPISEGLFADERHRAPSLLLTGRVFPGSAVVEVTNYQWIRDGKLIDVYYWCDVCSIRGSNPGACACCQGQVELKESPASEPLPK
jgi:hypothetical protein